MAENKIKVTSFGKGAQKNWSTLDFQRARCILKVKCNHYGKGIKCITSEVDDKDKKNTHLINQEKKKMKKYSKE